MRDRAPRRGGRTTRARAADTLTVAVDQAITKMPDNVATLVIGNR